MAFQLDGFRVNRRAKSNRFAYVYFRSIGRGAAIDRMFFVMRYFGTRYPRLALLSRLSVSRSFRTPVSLRLRSLKLEAALRWTPFCTTFLVRADGSVNQEALRRPVGRRRADGKEQRNDEFLQPSSF